MTLGILVHFPEVGLMMVDLSYEDVMAEEKGISDQIMAIERGLA